MPSQKEDIKDDFDQEGKLLSSQEREAFRMISIGNDLHSQRAIALLAIDEGETQEQAGQRAGLTAGQVKYWLGKFRLLRMNIFPEQVLMPYQVGHEQDEPDQDAEVTAKPKKSKKAKKSQGKKRKKKSAKRSKSKKDKKSNTKKGKDKTKKKEKGKKKQSKK